MRFDTVEILANPGHQEMLLDRAGRTKEERGDRSLGLTGRTMGFTLW
jgi:hypothetical protein